VVEKYGNFWMSNKKDSVKCKSNEKKLLDLEQKIRLLEKQTAALEHQLERNDKKAIFFAGPYIYFDREGILSSKRSILSLKSIQLFIWICV